MSIRRNLIVVFCAAMLAALTPAVSGAQTDPDGVLPAGKATSISLDDGISVDFAAQASQATDLDVHVEQRALDDAAATDTSGTELSAVGTEVLVVDALDANGRAVADFPHDVDIEAATEVLPARVSNFTAGVSITLPVDPELAAGVAAHTIAVYSRANADEQWEKLPSAYNPATGMVTADSDHLSEFAVLALADDAAGADGGVAAQVGDGPTVVLDPDDDLGFANWPEGRESELARNLQLAAAVETELVNACAANVVITRGDEPFVDKAVRGAVAQNANPDLTVTLAFNADSGEPFGDADNGGVLTWATEAEDKAFAQRFLETIPEFTGRPSTRDVQDPEGLLPYAELDAASGPHAHVEALFLDQNFDYPVIRDQFNLVVDAVVAAMVGQLESQGFDCGGDDGRPEPPTEEEIAELRDLGYQNYQAYGADPISFTTGNFIIDEYLFALPGVGDQVIDFTLTHNSQDDRPGIFGTGWSFAYNSSIQLDTGNSAFVRLGDGATYYFPWNGTGWDEPPKVNAELARIDDDELELTLNTFFKVRFELRELDFGVMSSATDRQGNTMSFDWGGRVGTGLGAFYPLESVTDEAGQRVTLTSNGDGHVTDVEHPDGRVWELDYAEGRLTAITDARGFTRQFAYSDEGWLERITDGEDMNFVSNTYDDDGRVTRQVNGEGDERTVDYQDNRTVYTDALGNETTYVYNDQGQVTETIDALGGSATTEFDDDFNPTEQTDARGEMWKTDFDDEGRPTKRTDPLGNETEYTYNQFGDLIKTEQPDGLGGVRTTTFDVNDQGRITKTTYDDGTFEESTFDEHGDQLTHTDANGNTTTYEFDERGNVTKTIDARGEQATATYTLFNKVETLTDANGNTVRYEYDRAENQTKVIDAMDAEWVYTYDANNVMTSETDPLGRVTEYTYDSNLNLTRVDYPDGTFEQFTLDGEYNIIETRDRRGNVSKTGYDQLLRPEVFTDETGEQWTTTYDEVGNPTKLIDPEDNTIGLAYDAIGRVVERTDPLNNVWKSVFDDAGNLTAEQAPDGTEVRTEYDALGRTKAIVDEEGNRLSFDYDNFGNPIQQIDRRGNVTKTDYDELNRPVRIINPDDGVSSTAYDAAGNIKSTTDPIGGTVTAFYDNRNRPVRSVDQLGAESETFYDLAGNPVRHVDAEGHEWRLDYDEMNRVVARTSPLGDVERTLYDGNGNVTGRILPDGREDRLVYNGRNELVEVIENVQAGGGGAPGADTAADVNVTTRYELSPSGDLEAVVNPNGERTEHDYDAMGRLLETIDPIGRVETNTYDEVGNLSSTTDGNNNLTRYQYFPDGQLQGTFYADDTSVTYAYDADNFQASMVDSIGTTTWTRDWRGNELTVDDANGNVVGHVYDLAGNVTELTYPGGFVSERTYDKASRPSTVTDASGTISFDRDLMGRPTEVSHPNGLVSAFAYDPEGKVTSIDHRSPKNNSGARFDYTYTPDDLVHTRDIAFKKNKGESARYTYDGVDRLIESHTNAQGARGGTSRYTYDPAGNRVGLWTDDDPTTNSPNDAFEVSYHFDAADQLLTERQQFKNRSSVIERHFDDNGNLTRQSEQRQNKKGKPVGKATSESFSYNLADDLIADGTSQWERDGMGRALTWTTGKDSSEQIYDDLWLIAQSGSTNESYVRDHDQALLSQSVEPNKTEVLLHDLLGTIYGVADKNAGTAQLASFSDFGVRIGQPPHRSVFGFVGEVQDPSGDRVHFYARSYDPATGRFFQQDRIDGDLTVPATQHNYLYAFANPTTFSDFLGYWGCCGIDVDIPNPVDTVKSVAGKVADGVQATASFAWEHRHEILDAAGMVPVIGEVADAANAVLYLAEGDYANAAISLAALVPVGGQAVTGARLAYKGANAATDLVRYSDEVVEAGSNITRKVTNAKDTASTAASTTRSTARATESTVTATRTADTATTARRTDGVVAAPPKSATNATDKVAPASTPAAKSSANAAGTQSTPTVSTKVTQSGRVQTSPGNGPIGPQQVALDSSSARALSTDGPIGRRLENQLEGCSLVMCQTAFREFDDAVSRLAGPTEKATANALMQRVTVLQDNVSARAAKLRPTRRLEPTDITIFGSADQLGVTIFTSDARALRAAASQGVVFDAIVHPPASFRGL